MPARRLRICKCVQGGMRVAAGLFMLTFESQTVFVAGIICFLGFTYVPGAMLYAAAPGVVPKGTKGSIRRTIPRGL